MGITARRAWLAVHWTGASLAILGTIFVSAFRDPYVGNWIWLAANVLLITCSVRNKAWPFVFMFSVYWILSVVGILNWA